MTTDNGERSTAVAVRVYRQGHLVDSSVCESEAAANALIAHWSDVDGVEFEVDDLSTPHRPGDILEPDASSVDDHLEDTSPRS
jgi:hypothetical protein